MVPDQPVRVVRNASIKLDILGSKLWISTKLKYDIHTQFPSTINVLQYPLEMIVDDLPDTSTSTVYDLFYLHKKEYKIKKLD